MIRGEINTDREAIVPVRLLSYCGEYHDIEAVVDTGFSGFLSLPPALIENLELPFAEKRDFHLGDNQPVAFELFPGAVLWDEIERIVVILASEGPPTLGMDLLYGYRVSMEVVDGGEVTITAR